MWLHLGGGCASLHPTPYDPDQKRRRAGHADDRLTSLRPSMLMKLSAAWIACGKNDPTENLPVLAVFHGNLA